jgi:adenylate cyclase
VSTSNAERKLAAILSADVFGYSRLMAEDEGATVRTIQAYREQVSALIREHRGRLADFSGDNFLAEFPSALNAVECAIEIQRVLRARNAGLPDERKMQFRIGAHLGDVRVEGERLFGDGVNIAARLESLAEPGGICISATVHEQVRNHLPVAFDDLGDRSVKNIPDQVRAYQVHLDQGPTGVTDPQASRTSARKGLVFAALALAVLVLGVWAAWPRLLGLGLDATGVIPSDAPALPEIPSIAVLPFTNMSGDPEQEYFADGITEDLLTALSGTSSLFVISRNSSFTYKGRAVKVEDVGRELGVRYVLEGSVRRAGDEVRITAQLIDATSGFHVWGDRYDRHLEDIFELQSEISERILGAVGAEITGAELERIRRKPTEHLTAYDAFARAQFEFFKFTRASHALVRRELARAIEIDPDYAAAHSLLGSTHSAEYGLFWTLDPQALERAASLARRAMELDGTLALPYITLAGVNLSRRQPEAALKHLESARKMAPSDYTSYLFTAMVLSQQDRQLEALGYLQRGLRLNPRLSGNAAFATLMGNLYARTGRADEAVALWQEARDENPDLIGVRLWLADRAAEAGDLEAARKLVEEAVRVQPELTVEAFVSTGMGAQPSERARLVRNLGRAGLARGSVTGQ